jgi:hypothetical protein
MDSTTTAPLRTRGGTWLRAFSAWWSRLTTPRSTKAPAQLTARERDTLRRGELVARIGSFLLLVDALGVVLTGVSTDVVDLLTFAALGVFWFGALVLINRRGAVELAGFIVVMTVVAGIVIGTLVALTVPSITPFEWSNAPTLDLFAAAVFTAAVVMRTPGALAILGLTLTASILVVTFLPPSPDLRDALVRQGVVGLSAGQVAVQVLYRPVLLQLISCAVGVLVSRSAYRALRERDLQVGVADVQRAYVRQWEDYHALIEQADQAMQHATQEFFSYRSLSPVPLERGHPRFAVVHQFHLMLTRLKNATDDLWRYQQAYFAWEEIGRYWQRLHDQLNRQAALGLTLDERPRQLLIGNGDVLTAQCPPAHYSLGTLRALEEERYNQLLRSVNTINTVVARRLRGDFTVRVGSLSSSELYGVALHVDHLLDLCDPRQRGPTTSSSGGLPLAAEGD